MSTETPKETPTPPAAKPFHFDETKAKSHIEDIRNFLKGFIGKVGMNPFTYDNRIIKPLEERLAKGERTESLYREILAIKKEEPLAKKFPIILR